MLFDSHCHLNFAAYKDEVDEIVSKAADCDVAMINIGTKYDTSQKAVEQANRYLNVWAVIGVHPIHLVDDIEEQTDFGADGGYTFVTKKEIFAENLYRQLAANKKVVGFGETGLDYFHLPSGQTIESVKKIQEEVFRSFINLAIETDKALVIHCRGSKENPQNAYDDILEILKDEKLKRGVLPRGVIHCFGGTLSQAQDFVKLGLAVGFTGIVTFKNAKELQQIAVALPLESILVETDAPFLAPEPHRGKRNEPSYVVKVAEKIAELKNLSLAEVSRQTTVNVKNIFKV